MKSIIKETMIIRFEKLKLFQILIVQNSEILKLSIKMKIALNF